MIRFVTYSAANMTISRDKCAQDAAKNGADEVHVFHSGLDVSQEFYKTNKAILDAEFAVNYEPSPRPCNGYWLHKPYFINRVMMEAQDGDYIVYVDAGCEIISPLNAIIPHMDQDVFLFTNGLTHIEWCKMDVIAAINKDAITVDHSKEGYFLGYDPHYIRAQQVQASAMWIRVSPFSRKFIKEWLIWCQMPGMIDDSPSELHNYPTFASHRYDQAILCCLQIKYELKTHWWPDARWFESQRYRWPEDTYPSMFIHHRKRNEEWS